MRLMNVSRFLKFCTDVIRIKLLKNLCTKFPIAHITHVDTRLCKHIMFSFVRLMM